MNLSNTIVFLCKDMALMNKGNEIPIHRHTSKNRRIITELPKFLFTITIIGNIKQISR